MRLHLQRRHFQKPQRLHPQKQDSPSPPPPPSPLLHPQNLVPPPFLHFPHAPSHHIPLPLSHRPPLSCSSSLSPFSSRALSSYSSSPLSPSSSFLFSPFFSPPSCSSSLLSLSPPFLRPPPKPWWSSPMSLLSIMNSWVSSCLTMFNTFTMSAFITFLFTSSVSTHLLWSTGAYLRHLSRNPVEYIVMTLNTRNP